MSDKTDLPPGPWRWDTDGRLVDANGNTVLAADWESLGYSSFRPFIRDLMGEIDGAEPVARAIVALPELVAAARAAKYGVVHRGFDGPDGVTKDEVIDMLVDALEKAGLS